MNVKIFIDHMGSQMGASRSEIYTKFWFGREHLVEFCQNYSYLRQINSRYHLSTLEITCSTKKQKIFFKHLKALCPGT